MGFEIDKSLLREHYQIKETIVTIISEKKSYFETAKKEIQKRRNEIEEFIRKDEFFKVTLKPYKCSDNSPEIIQKMCKSSKKLNVGPMATVAGIIAEYAVKAMILKGAKHAIVDNGGDIAIFSKKPINIGIYTRDFCTDNLAFKVPTNVKILGICTSSGKIGHSLSFGNTDAVTVFSHDLSVADAAATALGNLVYKGEDIEKLFKIFKRVKEIIGSVVIIDRRIGLWGYVPRIIHAKVPYGLITRGR